MTQVAALLDESLDFDPAGDFDAFCRAAPAKWTVYLLSDAADRPIQLLCVKNLRYSLKRRLGGEETIALSRRVNYRDIVRNVRWRRVSSAFEADWIYYEAARQVFPGTYQAMVGFRPAWFIHVDPEAAFPRYVKAIDLSRASGRYIGPLEDKHAAARLIELVEDCFDLCRYYNILTQAPSGRACAYKEMGKCPAPCDGSISIPQYRRLIDFSARTLIDPAEFIREQKKRMEAASAALRFESAGKIKSFIDQISQLGKGPWRHARSLHEFCYVSLQRGPRSGQAKLFLITPGEIEELVDLLAEPAHPADLIRLILSAAENRPPIALDAPGAERIGIVAHHLFLSKQTHGIFLPLDQITESALQKSYKDLQKQKPPDEAEEEGVLKELQAMTDTPAE